nr:PREDICTED: m7GpppX diphosphatase [Bemisia tabaci]
MPETPHGNGEETKSVNTSAIEFKDLSKFVFKRILNVNSKTKFICAEGSLQDQEGSAVLVLEKKALDEQDLQALCTKSSELQKLFINDIFHKYNCYPDPHLNGLNATIIYPATEKLIQKYASQVIHIVEETPALYDSLTLPHILKTQNSLEWVYNILDHKSEQERIVFEDDDEKTGFVLLPDLKWDGVSVETLYLLAIIRRRDIKSLRDLTGEHLPLLKNIYQKGIKTIQDKYKLPKSRLRIYFHYQPSFYHLHIHFTSIQFEAPGTSVERGHLLSSVITNLEAYPFYYRDATLCFTLPEIDPLFAQYKAEGITDKAEI